MFKKISENRNESQNQELFLFSFLGLVALLLSAPYLLDGRYIADNCAMYLDCARLMLAGKAPYSDFVDLNPPFVMYAGLLPALASGILNLPLILVFKVAVFSLSIFSVFLSGYFLLSVKRLKNYVPVMIFALCFAGSFLKFQYGERDHLFILCYLPFFFLRLARHAMPNGSISGILAILTGLVAGVGVCFKPICLIVPVVAECFYVRRKKKQLTSPETISFGLVLLLYLLSFLFLPNEALRQYFSFLAPLTLFDYSVFNIPADLALTLFCYNGAIINDIVLFFLIVLISFALRKTCSLIPPLLALTMSGYVLCAAQAKGWGYHQCIAYFGSLLLLFVNARALLELFYRSWKNLPVFLENKKRISQPMLSLILFLFLPLPFTLLTFQDSGKSGFALDDIRSRVLSDTKSGESLVVISSSVSPAYPMLIEEKRENGSKYLWSVPLVMLDHAKDRGFANKEEKRIFDSIFSDIESRQPKLVFIESTLVTWTCPSTLLQMANRQGFIEKLENDYEQIERSDRFLSFRRRQGAAL